MISAIHTSDVETGLKHIQTGLYRQNTRNLGLDFKAIGMSIWNFLQKIKNNANLSCGFLPGDKVMVTEPFLEAKVDISNFEFDQPEIILEEVLGKIKQALANKT